MTAAQQSWMDSIARLPDAVFLQRDDAAVRALPAAVLQSGFTGLWLGGARSVPLGPPALPVLLINAQSAARSAAIEMRRNAMVVATDVDTGDVLVADALPGNDEKSPPDHPAGKEPAGVPPPPVPTPVDPGLMAQLGIGNSAGTAWLDMQQLLQLPKRAGRWALRVIAYDQITNPVYTQIGTKTVVEPELSGDQARALVERLRTTGKRPPGLPSYVRVPETPVLASNGVALVLGRSDAVRGSGPIPAHVALKVPVTGPRLVRPVGQAVGAAPPKAIARAMLLVVFRDSDVPVRIPVEVPVWTEQPIASGQAIEAAFSVDLAAHLPPAVKPGVYQVYLLAGPYASGPHALTLR